MASKADSPKAVVAGEPRRPWALNTPPPFPAAAMRVISLLHSNDQIGIKTVVQCIESDPVFAAEVLRVANSALFGGSQKTGSVQKAILILGLDFVKALAITVGMRVYVKSSLQVPVLRSCWTHSLATGVLTEDLAGACLVSASEAYTAGLLHDIGRIGLMACYPVEYGNILSVSAERSFDLLQTERDLFDIDHCQAGAWLAGTWGLPPDIVLAAMHHHEAPTMHKFSIPNLVALGCRLADCLGFTVVGSSDPWTFEDVRNCLPEQARNNHLLLDIDALRERVIARIETIA